jgi:hypothetical protein
VSPGASPRAKAAQAWVELRSADPWAWTALHAIRTHLPEGRPLRSLRRVRMFELSGTLPARGRLEDLLHRSTQFYNPHKEACVLRRVGRDPVPVAAGETTVLVWEREGGRCGSAERWLKRETGKLVRVRESVLWVLGWDPGVSDAERLERTRDLAVLRDRRHGLLANPHAEDVTVHAGAPPLPALPGS